MIFWTEQMFLNYRHHCTCNIIIIASAFGCIFNQEICCSVNWCCKVLNIFQNRLSVPVITLPCRLYLSVKLMFSLAIFITYGLQFYVPVVIIWYPLREKLQSRTLRRYGEYIFRLSAVTVTCELINMWQFTSVQSLMVDNSK